MESILDYIHISLGETPRRIVNRMIGCIHVHLYFFINYQDIYMLHIRVKIKYLINIFMYL